MDLIKDIPDDPFAKRGKLFAEGIQERIDHSVGFIKDTYPQKSRLYDALDFMDYVYQDCFRGSLREWDKHGGFPATETGFQFDYAIKHALTGSYQAAYSHLRSCLELTLLTVYFSFEKHFLDGDAWLESEALDWNTARKNERKWLESLSDTPFFSAMIRTLLKQERFADFNHASNWFESLKQLYYQLSDHTHIKGYKMGSQAMNRPTFFIGNSSFHNVNTDTLAAVLDLLISMVQNVVILITLYNPIVLAELPLEEKFGMNEPIGFIHPGQSESLTSLIPLAYRPYFEQLKENDMEIIGIVEWVNNQPSLTPEQFKKQLDDFSSF